MTDTLLLEIGTEELPPKALPALSAAFTQAIVQGLEDAGIDTGQATSFATPRRLAVSIARVPGKGQDQNIEKLGPAVDKAFDADGNPKPAAEGFARSCGVGVAELERKQTDKGERLAYAGVERGAALADLLPKLVADALKRLPVPKRMRWGTLTESFVRPVQWLVALHGETVVELSLFGHTAGRVTQGHRFHGERRLELNDADQYADTLREKGHVIAGFDARREIIQSQVNAAANALDGEALIDMELLDEVTALVEWPVALAGQFDSEFLVLPREALIATMQGHQRYFPVQAGDGTLKACFITVANIKSREPERVVAGNERVVRPRLADALFFWNTDRRRGLGAYAAELAGVSFQRDLGSVADKSERVLALASHLAGDLRVETNPVARAAYLAKADLLSEMVGEFPELQGTMGRYYAREAGESAEVAQAIEEQYAPRGAGAPIPESPTGQVLALADKLDTLAGIFAIGKRPSGDKDPFALRRAALGVLRIAIEADLAFSLPADIKQAVAAQPVSADVDAITADLLDFLLERLRAYLADAGFEPGVFESVANLGLVSAADFFARVQAVRGFLSEPAAQNLCAAHKRIRNILKKQRSEAALNPDLLTETAEKKLYDQLTELDASVRGKMQGQEYPEALHELSKLQQPVDDFFAEVLVMSEDKSLKNNRLALLSALDELCLQVADISQLSAE